MTLNHFLILVNTALIASKPRPCFNVTYRPLTPGQELFRARNVLSDLCFLIIFIVTCEHHIKMKWKRSRFNVLSAIKIIIHVKLSLNTALSMPLTAKFVQCANSVAKVSRKLLYTWTCTLSLTCTSATIVRAFT